MNVKVLLLIIAISLLVHNSYAMKYECLSFVSNIYDEGVVILNLNEIEEQIQEDSEFRTDIEANPVEYEKIQFQYIKCADVLMRRGQLKAVEKIIEILALLKMNINNDLKMIGNHIKREIDSIVHLASTKKQIQTVTPVFQWAQNRYNVVMQVKFAHRFDSPGCLEMKNTVVDFTSNGLYLSTHCTQSNNPLHFILNITLHEDIDLSKTYWKMESVGRLFINMTKTVSVIWENLLIGTEKVGGSKIWWEMKDSEEYEKDMETFSKILEEAEEKETCMNNPKCKKKKEQQKKSNIQANNVIVDGRRVDGDDLSSFINIS